MRLPLLWALLAAVPLSAQSDELHNLIQSLRAAPGELQARGLLTLVERGITKALPIEKALIEECFHLAAGAQREMPLAMIGGASTEDPDFLLARASNLGLDRLSLQSLAVRLLIPRDPLKARDLFALIPLPPYRRLTCADRLADKPDPYYHALDELLRHAFSPSERASGLHLALLNAEIARLSTPLQMDPLLQRLNSIQWTRAEYAQLVAALGAALGRMRVDDRTFSAVARTLHGLIPRLEQFGLSARASGAAADPIAIGIHQFLSAHFPAPRCADTAANPKPPPAGVRMLPTPDHPPFPDDSLPEVANYFNHKLRFASHLPSADLPPLSPEQMQPASLLGRMEPRKIYWSNAWEILLLARRLLWVETFERHYTEKEKNSADWQRRAAEYRRYLDDYVRVEGQPAESYYLHKLMLTGALWELHPDGAARDAVLADLVRLLATTDKREVGLDLWVLGVRDTLDRGRRGRPDRSVAPALLEALRQSGDPVLALLAATPSYL